MQKLSCLWSLSHSNETSTPEVDIYSVLSNIECATYEYDQEMWLRLWTVKKGSVAEQSQRPLEESNLAWDIACFDIELAWAWQDMELDSALHEKSIQGESYKGYLPLDSSLALLDEWVLPEDGLCDDDESQEPYGEEHHTATALHQDEQIPIPSSNAHECMHRLNWKMVT